jgi:hypothetical protein
MRPSKLAFGVVFTNAACPSVENGKEPAKNHSSNKSLALLETTLSCRLDQRQSARIGGTQYRGMAFEPQRTSSISEGILAKGMYD